MDRFLFTGAANTIGVELHLSLSQIGYIASAFLIVYTVSTIPLGLLADRTSRKKVIALSVGIWSVATALTAITTNFLTLFLSRMILGIGEGGYFPAGTALLSDCFNRERRARVLSLWNIAQYIGILGGYVIGGMVAGLAFGSWRYAFLITAIPGLITAFVVWRIREPQRNQADLELEQTSGMVTMPVISNMEEQETTVEVKKASLWQQWFQLLRVKSLVVLMLMQVFSFFVLGVCSNYLPIYLHQSDTFDFSAGTAGLYSGAILVVAGLIGTVAGGYFSDLLGRWYGGARILICGISFTLCAPAIALTLLSHNIVSFSIFLFLTIVLISMYSGPHGAATQEVVPLWLRASAYALLLMVAHLCGDAFSPALVGILATQFDPTHGQHFQMNMAGHDLAMALLVTCTPALLLAGLIGIFGARWLQNDIAVTVQLERERQA
jgi:MFS family permease